MVNEKPTKAATLQVHAPDPFTKGVIFEGDEEIDFVLFDFWIEDRAKWERAADKCLHDAGYHRISEWRDDGNYAVADIVKL